MSGQQIAPPSPQVTGDVLDFDEVWTKFDATVEWLARTYVHAMNCIHYMHDKLLLRTSRNGAARP